MASTGAQDRLSGPPRVATAPFHTVQDTGRNATAWSLVPVNARKRANPATPKPRGAGVYICLHGILIGERIVCVDVDECAVGNNNCTSLNAKCINQAGSFACVCNDGFVGDGHTCTEHAPLHKSILCYVEEFELTPPSSTADRVCAPLTICADDEYEV